MHSKAYKGRVTERNQEKSESTETAMLSREVSLKKSHGMASVPVILDLLQGRCKNVGKNKKHTHIISEKRVQYY